MMTMMKMMNQHFPKMTTIKALLYHTKTSQALLKTNRPFLGTGFYWIASLKWMNLLTKIQDLKHVLVLHYNAGKAIVTQKGDLKGDRTVWYYPKGIALHKVQKKHKVTYDNSEMTRIVVHNF